jgi:hypothetical protein
MTITKAEIQDIVHAVRSVANAITTPAALPGKDAAEGSVTSLTEATMGITAGLFAIARAIEGMTEAITEFRSLGSDIDPLVIHISSIGGPTEDDLVEPDT